jgi:DNA-binding NtrC family response regulator
MSLRNENFDTDTAYDGVEAVLKTLDGIYDVVLLDIRMPKLDGIGALKIIKRVLPDLPIIMFTGQAGRGDMIASTRLGAYTCLLKPVSLNQLVETIYQVVVPKEKFQQK